MLNDNTNTQEDLIYGILHHGIEIIDQCDCSDDISQYVNKITIDKLNYPIPKKSIDKNNWFMPDEYKSMDIEKFLIEICPASNLERLNLELIEYRKRNLITLLKQMKYIIDTLKKNNIVWGVGRGSSVASYTLFLLGVHKIDSVKYKLPLDEFFKGDKNG